MEVSPRLLVVRRGQEEESFHRGRAVVATAAGEKVLTLGAVDAPVFPRSSIKPIQAIPLVTSGAADKYGFRVLRLHSHVDRMEDHHFTWPQQSQFSKRLVHLMTH